MLMTLLSMLGGGLMRLLPEVLAMFNKRTENTYQLASLDANHAHELAMLDRQVELEKTRATTRTFELQQTSADLHYKGGVDEMLALLDAQKAALAGQMQTTGMGFVDALNWLVRPLATYYFLVCYGIFKTAMLFVALKEADPWRAVVQIYSEEDWAIMSALISFWFVGRSIEKRGGSREP